MPSLHVPASIPPPPRFGVQAINDMGPVARVEIIASLSDDAKSSLLTVLPDSISQEIEQGLTKWKQKLAAAEVAHHSRDLAKKQDELHEALRASSDPLVTASERATALKRLEHLETEITTIEVTPYKCSCASAPVTLHGCCGRKLVTRPSAM